MCALRQVTVEKMLKYQDKIHELKTSQESLLDQLETMETQEETLQEKLEDTERRLKGKIVTLEVRSQWRCGMGIFSSRTCKTPSQNRYIRGTVPVALWYGHFLFTDM